MHRRLKIIAAVFVLLCVVTICIAPSVDLPDTAMRYRQAWVAVLLSIVTILLFGWLPSLFFLLTQRPGSPVLIFDPDRTRSQRTC